MEVNVLKEVVLDLRPSLRIGILHARENNTIVDILVRGATERLLNLGVKQENIIIQSVPGPFELSYSTQLFIDECMIHNQLDAVIPIGVLIKGTTMNYEYICNSITSELMNLSIHLKMPIIFGILTLTEGQAQEAGMVEGSMYMYGEYWGTTAVEMCTKFTVNRRKS